MLYQPIRIQHSFENQFKNKDLISLNIIGSIGNTIYVEDIVVRVDNTIGGEVSIKQELIENNWARYSKSDEDNVRNQLQFIAPKSKLGFQIFSNQPFNNLGHR